MKLIEFMDEFPEGTEITCWDNTIDSEFYMYKPDTDKSIDPEFAYVDACMKFLLNNLEIIKKDKRGVVVNLYDLLDKPEIINYAKENMFKDDQYRDDSDVVEMLFDDMIVNINDGIENLSKHYINSFGLAYPKELEKLDTQRNLEELIYTLFSNKNISIQTSWDKNGTHMKLTDLDDGLVYKDKQIAMLLNEVGIEPNALTIDEYKSLDTFMKNNFNIAVSPFQKVIDREQMFHDFKVYCHDEEQKFDKLVKDRYKDKFLIYTNDYLVTELNKFSSVEDLDLGDMLNFNQCKTFGDCIKALDVYCYDFSNEWYEEEKIKLNKDIDADIAVFIERGLWNGRQTGLAFVGGHNLNKCLECPGNFDCWTVYVDQSGNLKGEGLHHDGINYYTFFECDKHQVKEAFEKGKNISSMLKPLGYKIEELYGFNKNRGQLDKYIDIFNQNLIVPKKINKEKNDDRDR